MSAAARGEEPGHSGMLCRRPLPRAVGVKSRPVADGRDRQLWGRLPRPSVGLVISAAPEYKNRTVHDGQGGGLLRPQQRSVAVGRPRPHGGVRAPREWRVAHISEVDNGKACGRFCLACDEAMIARQGAVREHSFAHQSGSQCQHAMDAMLHGVIQRLIERYRRFVTPELIVSAAVAGPHGPLTGTRTQPPINVPVDSVALVVRSPWRHPCVEAEVKGHSVLLHVAAKRSTQGDKRHALAQARQAAIEIDLSGHGPRTVGDLARLLFDADARKTWLFNPKGQAIEAEIRAALQPQADQEWAAHHAAQGRQRELQRERALALAKERADRQRLVSENLACHEAAEYAPETQSPAPIRQHAKPAELSPTVEYASPAGKLWLLYSSDGSIYLRVEDGLKQALDVIDRYCAEPLAEPGIWRISTAGWSSAIIALSRLGTTVRTTTESPSP